MIRWGRSNIGERPAAQARRRASCVAAGWLLASLASAALGQEAAGDLEDRARALAAEQLGPLLEALGRRQVAAQPEGVRFEVRFAGNVQGLEAGAPVTIRGLRVGTVREIAVTFDSGTGQLEVPVVIDVVPGSLVLDGRRPETEADVRAAMATLVERACGRSWRVRACSRRRGRSRWTWCRTPYRRH